MYIINHNNNTRTIIIIIIMTIIIMIIITIIIIIIIIINNIIIIIIIISSSSSSSSCSSTARQARTRRGWNVHSALRMRGAYSASRIYRTRIPRFLFCNILFSQTAFFLSYARIPRFLLCGLGRRGNPSLSLGGTTCLTLLV